MRAADVGYHSLLCERAGRASVLAVAVAPTNAHRSDQRPASAGPGRPWPLSPVLKKELGPDGKSNGRIPAFARVRRSIVCAGQHVFNVHRLIQYDKSAMQFGSRKAMVNYAATTQGGGIG